MAWLRKKKHWWGAAGVAALLISLIALSTRGHRSPAKADDRAETRRNDSTETALVRVEVIRPAAGGIVRTTVQPGSAHSFESVDMFAKVSGFLKSQGVDIGTPVKSGQLLAEIDVPELAEELERDKALLQQAEAEVVQAQARLTSVIAERKAADAFVNQSRANVKRSESEREYRDKQYQRIHKLHALDSIEARLVDEKLDQLQAARAGELAAQSGVITAEEQAAAAAAKVGGAEADIAVAQAKVKVAQAGVSRTKAMLSYTRITAPCDGVITHRGFHPGAFIRSANQGEHQPLLSVDRIDLMRVVVQVPDRDVPFTQPGDKAVVVFDALPSMRLSGTVSRISASENSEARSMRVEIDVPNRTGLIRDGMYGHVEIELESASNGVTVPSSCLVGDIGAEQAKVFVVDRGALRLANVKIGKDTGKQVEIVSGLTVNDLVVVRPPSGLKEGAPVQAIAAQPESKSGH